MLKIKDIINFLETIAPLALQEEYDNSGLAYGCIGSYSRRYS
jgi:putative NIF3 family GTP cyclohydrolase 1 type 2